MRRNKAIASCFKKSFRYSHLELYILSQRKRCFFIVALSWERNGSKLGMATSQSRWLRNGGMQGILQKAGLPCLPEGSVTRGYAGPVHLTGQQIVWVGIDIWPRGPLSIPPRVNATLHSNRMDHSATMTHSSLAYKVCGLAKCTTESCGVGCKESKPQRG